VLTSSHNRGGSWAWQVFCDDLVGYRSRLGIVSRTYHEEGAEDEFNDENGNPLPPVPLAARSR